MEEKIKESEGATDAPVKPHSKKHRVRTLIREMWPAYLIEVLVIILGISITLALEEWRDNSKEAQLERIYRRNLLGDIETDLQSLKYATENTRQLLEKGGQLLKFVQDPVKNPLSLPQMDAALQSVLGRPNFASGDATFSDLKSSGNLHLIKDIRLKSLLFAYYSQAQTIRAAQDAEQQATIVISGPYFLKRFPLLGNSATAPALAGNQELRALPTDVEFGNNVFLRVTNREELLTDYQKADSLAIQLKNALSD
jgi:type II secretory pathway pseudopilin PulG